MNKKHREKCKIVLAFAFDSFGVEILDSLASKINDYDSNALILYYIAMVSDEFSPGICRHRTPSSTWTAPKWISDVKNSTEAIENIIYNALDLSQYGNSVSGFPQIDLVLLARSRDNDELIPTTFYNSLSSLRYRFKRISRILLFVHGNFQPVGEASAGLLERLPTFTDKKQVTELDLFDQIILIDNLNTAGFALSNSEDLLIQTSTIISILTLSEFASSFHRLFQANMARGPLYRYLSVGVSEWRFDPSYAREMIAKYLYGEMVKQVIDGTRASKKHKTIEKSPLSESVAQQILDLKNKESVPEKLFEHDQNIQKKLRDVFVSNGYRLASLDNSLKQISKQVSELRDKTTQSLVNFMDVFTKWYVKHKLGKNITENVGKGVKIEYVTNRARISLFIISSLVLTVSLIIGFQFGFQDPIIASFAVVSAISMFVLLAQGFKNKHEYVLPYKTRDMIQELRDYRARQWMANELDSLIKQRIVSLQHSINNLMSDLKSADKKVPNMMPLPDDVCEKYLKSVFINVQESINSFWKTFKDPLEASLSTEGNALVFQLKEYTTKCCSSFGKICWNDILHMMGGQQALDHEVFQDIFKRAQKIAMPWMPIKGSMNGTVIALSRTLSKEIQDTILKHFPSADLIQGLDSDGILILNWSQGYYSRSDLEKETTIMI